MVAITTNRCDLKGETEGKEWRLDREQPVIVVGLRLARGKRDVVVDEGFTAGRHKGKRGEAALLFSLCLSGC